MNRATIKRLLTYINPLRYISRLDRYIIGKFIGTYIYAIILIISISIVFDVNENLAKFTQYHAPLKAIVFDYYMNFVPYFANLFSPLFVFIAVIFFTSKLAGNSEIIAMLAAGISFKRLMRPYMISCVLISALSFYLSAYVIPHGTVIRQNFETMYKNKKRVTAADNVMLQVGKGVIAYIQHYDNSMKKGYGFSLDRFEEKVKPGGILIYDGFGIINPPTRKDINVYRIDAMDKAADMKNAKVFNMIVLGGLLKVCPVVSTNGLHHALFKSLPERHHAMIPLNMEAVEVGMNIIEKQN